MKTLNLALVLSLLLTSGPGWALVETEESQPPAEGTQPQEGAAGKNPFTASKDQDKENPILSGSKPFERCQKLADISWVKYQESFPDPKHKALTEDHEELYEGVWHDFVEGKLRGERGLKGEFDGKISSSGNKQQVQQEIQKKIESAEELLKEIRKCAALVLLTSLVDYQRPADGQGRRGSKPSYDGRTECRTAGFETQDYPFCLDALNMYAAGKVGSQVGEMGSGMIAGTQSTTAIENGQKEVNDGSATAPVGTSAELAQIGQAHANRSGVFNGISAGAIGLYGSKIPTTESIITNQCVPGFPPNFGHSQYNRYIKNYLEPIAKQADPKVTLQELETGLSAPGALRVEAPSEGQVSASVQLEKECSEQAAKTASEDQRVQIGKNPTKQTIEEAGGAVAESYRACFQKGLADLNPKAPHVESATPYDVCVSASQGVSLTMNSDVKNFMEEQATSEGMAGILDLLKGLLMGQQADKLAEAKKDMDNMKADPNLAPKLGKFDASKMKGNPFKLPEDFCVKNPKDPKCSPTVIPKSDRTVSPTIGGLNFTGGDPNRAQGISDGGEDAVPLATGGVDLNNTPPTALGDLVPEGFNSPEFTDPKVAAGGVTRTIGAGGGGGAAGVGGTGLPGSGAAPKAPGDPSKKANSSAVGDAYKNVSGGAYRNLAAGKGGNNREEIDPFKKFRDGAGTKGSVLNYRGPASQITNGDLFQTISTAYQKANTNGKLLEYIYKEGNEDAELKDPDLGL